MSPPPTKLTKRKPQRKDYIDETSSEPSEEQDKDQGEGEAGDDYDVGEGDQNSEESDHEAPKQKAGASKSKPAKKAAAGGEDSVDVVGCWFFSPFSFILRFHCLAVFLTQRCYVPADLLATNRPYNATAIHENMHRPVSKPKLQKMLDDGVAAGTLGEAGDTSKVYFYNQAIMPVVTEEQADAEEAELETLEARIQELAANVSAATTSTNALAAEPTQQQLEPMIVACTKFNDDLSKSVSQYDAKAAAFGPMPDLNRMRTEIAFWGKHLKAIKRQVEEVVKEASCAMGQSEQEVRDMMGCE